MKKIAIIAAIVAGLGIGGAVAIGINAYDGLTFQTINVPVKITGTAGGDLVSVTNSSVDMQNFKGIGSLVISLTGLPASNTCSAWVVMQESADNATWINMTNGTTAVRAANNGTNSASISTFKLDYGPRKRYFRSIGNATNDVYQFSVLAIGYK